MVDTNGIPVNFQVGHNANALRAGSNLPGEVGDHGASETSGKAHVFNDADPIALRVLRFDVRGNDLDTRLISGIHRRGGEVVGIAIHDEAQRSGGIPGAKVEFDPMELGKAGKGDVGEIGDVLTVLFGQQGKNIVAAIVPGAGRDA